nr:UDP-glycosyltransferase 74E2-like [Ipomoea trifida]
MAKMSTGSCSVHQLGLRAAAFNSQSCAGFAVYHHTDQENLTAPTQGSTVSLPSMPPLGLNDLPSFVRNNSSYFSLLQFVLRIRRKQAGSCSTLLMD